DFTYTAASTAGAALLTYSWSGTALAQFTAPTSSSLAVLAPFALSVQCASLSLYEAEATLCTVTPAATPDAALTVAITLALTGTATAAGAGSLSAATLTFTSSDAQSFTYSAPHAMPD